MRLIIILSLLISSGLVAQDETANVWTFGGQYFEEGREIIENADGGFSVVGTSGTVGDNTNMLFMRFDADMNCITSSVFGDSGVEKGYSICEATDGGWVMCGMTLNIENGSYDVFAVHINDSGEPVWSKKLGGDGWDFGYRIIQFGDGYAIAGKTFSYSDNGGDGIVMFLTESGEFTHYWLFDLGGDEEWSDIDMLEDGSVLLTGTSASEDSQTAVLRSYDAEGGENWTFTKSPDGYQTRAIGSAVGNGYIWYTAITESEGVETACRGKLTTDGVEQSFIQQLQDGSYYFGHPVIADEFVVYPGNTTNYGAGGQDATIYMWNQAGPFVGAPTFGGTQHETLYHGIRTSLGEIYCTGSYTSFSEGVEQLAVIRLSAVYNGDYVKTMDYDGDCVSYLSTEREIIAACGNPVAIECLDMTGRVLFKGNAEEFLGENLSQGLYVMRYQDDQGCLSVKTVFIGSR